MHNLGGELNQGFKSMVDSGMVIYHVPHGLLKPLELHLIVAMFTFLPSTLGGFLPKRGDVFPPPTL